MSKTRYAVYYLGSLIASVATFADACQVTARHPSSTTQIVDTLPDLAMAWGI